MKASKPRAKRPAITASVNAVCPVCKARFVLKGTSALEVTAAWTKWANDHQHTGSAA